MLNKIVIGILVTTGLIFGFETTQAICVGQASALPVDGGSEYATVGNRPIVAMGGADLNPVLAKSSQDTLFAVYEHATSEADHDVVMAYYHKTNQKWFNRTPSGLFTSESDHRQPYITFDPLDNMYLVAKGPVPASVPGDRNVFWLLKKTPFGDTIYYLSNTEWYKDCSYPVLAANETGLWIAMQFDSAGERSIRVLYQAQGDNTFYIIPISNSSGGQHPSIAAGAVFSFVTYEINTGSDWDIFGTRAMTSDFGDPMPVAGTMDNERDPFLVASGDNFYMGYTREQDVWLAYSSDDGGSFNMVAVAATGAAERRPAVACNENKVYVAYLNDANQVLHKKSTNGGETWSASQLVSDVSAVVVDTFRATGAAFHPQDSTHVCWVDNRKAATTGWDIYYGMVGEATTGIAEDQNTQPSVSLLKCLPSPFTTATTIAYTVPKASRIDLRVYDSAGNLIRKLDEGERQPGTYELRWNGLDGAGERMPAGVYFIRLATSAANQTERIILMR